MQAIRTSGQGLCLWLLQRVTGALLVIGIGVHFYAGHYTGALTSEGVHERLQRGGWFLFDVLLVSMLAFHGMNGLRNIARDYNPRCARVIDIVAGVLVIAMVLHCARDLAAFRNMG